MLNYWLDLVRRGDKRSHLSTGARVLVESVLIENIALGMCFSEERDLLSQWRGYANDGAGFSISFKTSELDRLPEQDGHDASLYFEQVCYGSRDLGRTNEIVSQLAEAFMSDAEKFDRDVNGRISASLDITLEKRKIQQQAARKLFTVKNHAFCEEKEWRLYLFENPIELKNLHYRVSDNLISPYVLISFPASAITGVSLGPSNPTPVSLVERILRQNDVEAYVTPSEASYSGRNKIS